MDVTKTRLKSILVLEDDKEMQEMYSMIFNEYKQEYEVDFEDKAQEALKKIKEKKYDLIILDIIMEPMTGDSFFVYARLDKKNAEIPILVISVLSPESLEELKKINHVDFLQKPVTPEEFIKKVRELI